MNQIELNEKFLAQIAGWEAMKQARACLDTGSVLSSNWTPPMLRGVVQEGSTSYRAGLVIKSTVDIENVCHCRTSREVPFVVPAAPAAAVSSIVSDGERVQQATTTDRSAQRIRASAIETSTPHQLHVPLPAPR